MEYAEVKKKLLSLPEKDLDPGEGANPKEIEASEKQLQIKFPKSYISFLLDFGYGGFGHYEIFGLGKTVPRHLDIIKIAHQEWHECKPDYYIPKHLVPFCAVGNGDFHCFDTSRFAGDECPIVYWSHEDFYEYQKNPSTLTPEYDNFAEWLDDTIDNYLDYKKNG